MRGREAEAMGRLGDHPRIVTVHDVAEEGERVYLTSFSSSLSAWWMPDRNTADDHASDRFRFHRSE